MKVEDKKIICCTWKNKTECTVCEIEEIINCRYDKRKWLFFIINQVPTRFFAIFGLVLTGLLYRWWPLIAYITVGAFVIIFSFEVRIVCTHCPYYSSESKTLQCTGLTGSRKIWKYRPEPMKFWEKAVEALYFIVFLCWPVGFEAYLIWVIADNYSTFGLYSLLGIIALLSATIIASLQFVYIIRTSYCSKCVNFSCPMNTVSKEIVDTYLSKNEVMRKAWEDAGYKLGENNV